jgi:mRNA-degrading endonuclease RelE of RelBE toxin-antitoxin system
MLQIVFNEISAAELSHLPANVQFQLLDALNIRPDELNEAALTKRFGVLDRGGKKFFRCRAGDYRVYFAPGENMIRIHRVLHKNTLGDFLYRSNLTSTAEEDASLAQSKNFWQLIDEGAKTLKIA